MIRWASAAIVILGALCTPACAQRRSEPAAYAARHLSFIVSVTPATLVAGRPASLLVDVRPKPGIHVYAQGSSYRPVAMVLEPNALVEALATEYPPSTPYVFTPLNEQVAVYDRPFRLTRGLTVSKPDARTAEPATVTLRGRVQYQACDAESCYLPESVAFEQSVPIAW